MTRELLLEKICPAGCTNACVSLDCNRHCYEILNKFLDEYDKQIRAEAIDEAKDEIVHHLNDYALQEAPIYQDDMANQRPVYLAIKNCINGVIEVAERLKEKNK